MIDFAYCFDCKELNYAVVDKNGVFSRNQASSNHWDHRTYCFQAPEHYVAPIRVVLTKLQAGFNPSTNEMVLFKLAIELAEGSENFEKAILAKKGGEK